MEETSAVLYTVCVSPSTCRLSNCFSLINIYHAWIVNLIFSRVFWNASRKIARSEHSLRRSVYGFKFDVKTCGLAAILITDQRWWKRRSAEWTLDLDLRSLRNEGKETDTVSSFERIELPTFRFFPAYFLLFFLLPFFFFFLRYNVCKYVFTRTLCYIVRQCKFDLFVMPS